MIAHLYVDEAWVRGIVNGPLTRDFEDGLGDWVGTGGTLPSGACVELVKYKLSGEPRFQLRIDFEADVRRTLDDFIAATGLDPATVRLVDPPVRI